MTWLLMTFSQVAPLCRRPKYFGLCPEYRLLTGTVNRTPSAEATSPPPHTRAASIFAWASMNSPLPAEMFSARK